MPAFSIPRTFWEWTQTALLSGNLVWTTLCLGGYRPETMVVSWGLTGLLLTVHLLARAWPARATETAEHATPQTRPATGWWTGQRDLGGFHPAGWLLVPFLVYAAANVAWVTPVPWLGWRDWLGWLQMIAVFWVVLNDTRSRPARRCLLGTLLGLGFVAVVLGCYQRFVRPDWLMMGRVQVDQFIGRASGPFGIPNSLAALLLLLLPLAGVLALRRRSSAGSRVIFGYLTLVFVLGLLLTVSRGGWLALAVVLLIWPVVGVRGGWRKRLALATAVAALMAVSGTVVWSTMPLARDRLVQLVRDVGERSRPILWRGAGQIVREHPAWGSGAGSYNLAFEKHRPEAFPDEPRWAHNEYLNTASDYGLVGFALFFGAGGIVVWRCARARNASRVRSRDDESWGGGFGQRREAGRAVLDGPPVQQALAAGLAAFALQLCVDFHFKIPALAMLAAVVAGLWVQRRWPEEGEGAVVACDRRWPVVFAGLACVAAAGTAGYVLPMFRAEALRYEARQAIDRLATEQVPVDAWASVVGAARAGLQRAVVVDAANGAAWSDLSYASALQIWAEPERRTELAEAARSAADRALACSDRDAEFWVRRGVALDLQERWVDAGDAFARALTLAPARALVWYHHAFHLSLDARYQRQAVAAVEFCLRLDGGNREAQALRERLAGHRVP
jgi:O-antigen ligase